MKEIEYGTRLDGYGFCWQNWDRDTMTVAIIPFNIFLRYMRNVYIYLSYKYCKKRERIIHERISGSYNMGYKQGRKDSDIYYQQEISKIRNDFEKIKILIMENNY